MYNHHRLIQSVLLVVWAQAAVWQACHAASGPAGAANKLDAQEVADGWLLLFDGQSLFGWQQSQPQWKAADGALVADSPRAVLATTTRWADFVLRLDFRADQPCEGLVALRSTSPEDGSGSACQVSIAEGRQTRWPTGSLVGRSAAEQSKPLGQWRTLEVQLHGADLRVAVDGRQVLRETDTTVRRGHVALVCLQGQMAVRNIRLKPLGLKSIFNGKDLAGWKIPAGSKSTFTVTPEGWLNVKNGRGSIESEGVYGDFLLQLDVKVNGKGLNSGVFFRSIPDQMMNGYECQIHNAFKGQDRTQPVDCGTGGIFRRQNARMVIPDDSQWFTMTIHADGKHLATWVNGYQTADWTDDRPAHENPRNGCRLEPGSIQFQGHDPTTDLDFRNIRIAQLPP